MLDFCFDIVDGVIACFTRNLTWSAVLHTYWFLFVVEFPRYYFLEFVIAIWYKITYRQRAKARAVAKMKLYIENPLITILAPGNNEGKHIYNLVKSLNEQTYRNYEIIIVDDGSDDATPMICRDLEKAGLIDLYLRSDIRGGKASAANFGVHYAKGKYIVHLDADSSLDRDAIEKILIPFYYDPKIKAVGGTVKVRNSDETLCTSMQALEYLKTIQVGRMVTNALGIYHIISGAFGAFEREKLIQIGMWDIGPGLDGYITQKIRNSGDKVYFAEDAICMTNVPTAWHALFKQRQRWSKSLIRFRLRKHFDILMPHKHFSILIWISNMENLLYDCFFNFLWLFYIVSLIFMHTDRLMEIFLVGWMIRYCFSLVAFGVIMMVSERASEEKKLIPYLFVSTFYTGYFLRSTRLLAHIKELFFFSSYKDPWNPKKTSDLAQIEGI